MIDLEIILRFSFALALVLALIALLTWVARSRLGSRSLGLAGRRRLAIVENAVIDARTRVVLIRRDDAEHLIVVGSAGISTIETAIRSGVPATAGVKAEP